MKYIKVKWLHEKGEENNPVWLYSEIDEERWELRRVNIYNGGRIDNLNQDDLTKSALFGIEQYPELEFINKQKKFIANEITKQEFEEQWALCT